MNKIQILPDAVANRIAAGEVVERPASVVKELIENAIDAGADDIVVVMAKGGKTMIQVIDNGCGMSPEDAHLAFHRHATSKITRWEDLLKIKSFGFRGEALPSIASVADVEIRTKTSEDELATVLKWRGGELLDSERTAGPTGTAVTVKNLFYTVPARKNFLKSDATELRHAIQVLRKFALAYPSISWTHFHDDETVLQYPVQSFEERIQAVFSPDILEQLLPVHVEQFGVRIRGYVSKPGFSEKTKGEQFVYLNGRPIYNRTINFAVYSAYGQSIPKGDKPFYILFYEWNPEEYDVNVHPTKAEVKFRDDQLLYRMSYYAVRDALSHDQAIPSLGAASSEKVGFSASQELLETVRRSKYNDPTATQPFPELFPEPEKEPMTATGTTPATVTSSSSHEEKKSGGVENQVWQLHNRYIVSQIRSGLAFIDQHVAHERILYERAMEAFEQQSAFSQQLLFPVTMDFTHDDYAVLETILPLLEKIGFIIRKFGRRTVVIEAVPADVRLGNESRILSEMIDYYREHESQSLDPRDNLAKAFACKTAIKSGDPLTVEEMNSLIDQLFATKYPYVCPHGRPVIIQLSLEELDKRFMRTK